MEAEALVQELHHAQEGGHRKVTVFRRNHEIHPSG